jgi:hypothetical protein
MCNKQILFLFIAHKLNSLCCTFCSFYSLHSRVAPFLAFGCCTNPKVFHGAAPCCTSLRFNLTIKFYSIIKIVMNTYLHKIKFQRQNNNFENFSDRSFQRENRTNFA